MRCGKQYGTGQIAVQPSDSSHAVTSVAGAWKSAFVIVSTVVVRQMVALSYTKSCEIVSCFSALTNIEIPDYLQIWAKTRATVQATKMVLSTVVAVNG